MLKKTGLTEQLAGMAYPDKDCHQRKCVNLKNAIIKAGVAYRVSLSAMETLGPSVEDIVRKDRSKSRVTAVLQARMNLSLAVGSASEHHAAHGPSSRDSGQVAGSPATAAAPAAPAEAPMDGMDDDNLVKDLMLVAVTHGEVPPMDSSMDAEPLNLQGRTTADFEYELYQIDPLVPFQTLLSADILFDVLSRHLATHSELVASAKNKLAKIISPVTKENSWKKDFEQGDHALTDVLQHAGITLLKMDIKGSALRSVVDSFSEAHWHVSWSNPTATQLLCHVRFVLPLIVYTFLY